MLAIASLTTASASAQEATAPQPDEPGDSAREAYLEHRSLQHRVIALATLALEENARLAESWRSLQRTLEGAAESIDPATLADLERLAETRPELGRALAARDAARLRNLLEERRSLETSLRSRQVEVLDRDDVAAEMAAFRAALLAHLREREPEADALLLRLRSLAERFRSAAPGASPLREPRRDSTVHDAPDTR